MARTVAIGIQDFEQLIKNNYFYIDKTKFIKEWWERGDTAVILEFKVHDPQEEQTLQETAEAACRQIEEKQYQQILVEKGIPEHRIRKYGFAFAGKKVFIGKKAAG